MAKPPPGPTADLTAIYAALAALQVKDVSEEAEIAALRAAIGDLATRVETDETNLTTLQAHVDAIPAGTPFDPTAINAALDALKAELKIDEAAIAALQADPPPPPGPVDGNDYPLHQDVQTASGVPIDLGVGHDVLEIAFSVHNGSGASGVAVDLNGVAVVAPLQLVAVPFGQPYDITTVLTARGEWGKTPPTVQIVGTGVGLHNLQYLEVNYNYVPLVNNGPPTFRGDSPHVNSTSVWNNFDLPTTWTAPVAVDPPPPPLPVPDLTVISGASVNLLPVASGTLAELVGRLVAGDHLVVPGIEIFGTTLVSVPCIIEGIVGRTIVNCTGLRPTWDKGIFVVECAGVSIRKMGITGAHIDDGLGGNAAAIRIEGVNSDFDMQHLEVYKNDDGLLAAPAIISGSDCYFHDNGNGAHPGPTHNIYTNGNDGRSSLNLIRYRGVPGIHATHDLHVKSNFFSLTDSDCTGVADTTGQDGGAVVDISFGGKAAITRSTIRMGAGAANHNLLTYGLDGDGDNTVSGNILDLDTVTFIDTSGSGGKIPCGHASATLNHVGCTYAGTMPPQTPGWGAVNGSFTAAP